MVRKASTCERQTEVAGKKKLAGVDRLVAGVDFAPPEPIASVLPRIPLTTSQADDLWALVLPQIPLTSQADDLWEGRRRNPTDAEMAKEILASANLANAVQRALEFYVRDVTFLSMFLSSVAALRRSTIA